jgi:hypothetical protein
MTIPEMPKGIITIKNQPDGPRQEWTRESRGEITDWLGNAEEFDFIEIHVQRGIGNFVPLTVNVQDVSTVGDYH